MSFIFKKQKQEVVPNVLITNHCNQHCSYCFAQKEMKKTNKKEMSLEDFQNLVSIFKKNNIKSLRLMGGEPTIHSQFPEILQIADKIFDRILIFSNGVIPEKSLKAISLHIKKLELNFNIGTPIFSNQKKRRSLVKEIGCLTAKTKSSVAFTIFDLDQDYSALLADFDNKTLKKIGVAFSFAKSLYGYDPFFSEKDYLLLGAKIVKTIKQIKKLKVERIYLECGLKKEMFTKKQIEYISSNALMRGWGCAGKWGSFDIAVDLTVFPCFPFYQEVRLDLREHQNLIKLSKKLDQLRNEKGTCLL